MRTADYLGKDNKLAGWVGCGLSRGGRDLHGFFLERLVGSLEVGKRADLAIWDQNPYTMPAVQLKSLYCAMTILDGGVIFGC